MSIISYPGQDLSLSQLIFTLSKELNCKAFSPSFTFEQVSQLEQDGLTELRVIHEWRNSFIPINRIPLEILYLISTHLSSRKDLLQISFVCRHWRRSFLQHSHVWSKLNLSKGKDHVETFLGRAKGCTLDILAPYNRNFVSTWGLLSSHTKDIESLQLKCNKWADVEEIAQIASQPLPLLHSLTITGRSRHTEVFRTKTPPSPRLFNNAENLKEFWFHSGKQLPYLSHFAFPKLVSFYFSAASDQPFCITELLEFLKASPMLEKLHIEIPGSTWFNPLPPQGSGSEVVALPNVKKFTLVLRAGTVNQFGYQLAGHLSCPSATRTELVHRREYGIDPGDIFPEQVSWNAIVSPRYTKKPIEKVALQITPSGPMKCELGFWSPDGAVVKVCFEEDDIVDDDDQIKPSDTIHKSLFENATRSLQLHPQLKSIKRLDICHSLPPDVSVEGQFPSIPSDIWKLFKFLGPLDELTIFDCDPAPYFFGYGLDEPRRFPRTKTLRISNPINFNQDTYRAILDLVILQHKLHTPFREVFIRGMGIVEDVKRWPIDPSLSLPDVTNFYFYDG